MDHELDRKSLIIYLNDLRILETIKYQTKISCEKADDVYHSIAEKEVKLFPEIKAVEPTMPTMPTSSQTTDSKPSSDVQKITIAIFVFIIAGIITFFAGIASNIVILKLLGILLFVISIPLLIVKSEFSDEQLSYEALKIALKNYKEDMEYYEEEMKHYESVMKKNEPIAEKNKAIKKRHMEKVMEARNYRESLKKEIRRLDSRLTEAYSINVIPKPFRDIYGIYYLYDYLSSSKQSFSEALVQYNLEAIKQKLDKMIKLQGEEIVQYEQHHHEQMQMNQEILSAAQKSAKNSEENMKYAKMSSVDSAVARDLQAKQLVYQKANFWLNYWNK